MYVFSNAFTRQAEIVQKDHWDRGPLELVFVNRPPDASTRIDLEVFAVMWNSGYDGGFIRDGKISDELERIIPGLMEFESPHVFLVPSVEGHTELHFMLLSVVPANVVQRYGIRKERANLWLLPLRHPEQRWDAIADRTISAFHEFIWSRLARTKRCRYEFFSKDSPIKLLADDSRYWMSRLYRIALARRENMPVTEHEDEWWEPLEQLKEEFAQWLPADSDHENFFIRRPRMGGALWDMHDEEECEEVVEEMLDGCGLMEPIDPILDVIQSQPAHEDFSERYSWIKEDFERSFYSKRSRVRVTLIETIDEFPAWEHGEAEGYADVLFRDVLARFNRSDRELLIALRHGKTTSEIARECGYKSHSHISRRLAIVKERLRRLLK